MTKTLTSFSHLEFLKAIDYGAQEVIKQKDHLNEINLFPVPDADTGSNLAQTLKGLRDYLAQIKFEKELSSENFKKYLLGCQDACLMSARGNSGAIFTQFFFGLSETLIENQNENQKLTTEILALGFNIASQKALQTLITPIEGTMITIMRVWAESFREKLDFTQSLNTIEIILPQTSELNPHLKKLGTNSVDAGAQAMTYFLRGFALVLLGRVDSQSDLASQGSEQPETVHSASHQHDYDLDPKFRFCSECLLHLHKPLNNEAKDLLKAKLSSLGDSLVVAGGKDKLRIHLHTSNPVEFFGELSLWGRREQEKVDDMVLSVKLQKLKQDYFQGQKAPLGLVIDSACDLPEGFRDQHRILMVPTRLRFGEEEFIDKTTIDNQRFYHLLKTSPFHPKTSTPSPYDFKRVYQEALETFDEVIAFHVGSQLSSTYQLAQEMIKQTAPDKIHLVDGVTASCGLGIVVMKISRLMDQALQKGEKISVSQLKVFIEGEMKKLKVFLVLDTLTYLERGGRLNKFVGTVGNWLQLRPILTMGEDGKLVILDKVLMGQSMLTKFEKTLKKKLPKSEKTGGGLFALGYAEVSDFSKAVTRFLEKEFPSATIHHCPLSPALGAHAGPGAFCLAYLA